MDYKNLEFKDLFTAESLTYKVLLYKYDTGNSINEIIRTLVETVDSNFIEMDSISREDFSCLHSFMVCMLVDQVIVKQFEYEDLFLYHLIKSIYKSDKNLLKDLNSIRSLKEKPKTTVNLKSQAYTYNLIKRIIRLACKETDINNLPKLDDCGAIEVFVHVVYKVISMTCISDRDVSERMYDAVRNRMNNRLTVYAIYNLCSALMGKAFHENFIENLVKDEKKSSDKNYPQLLIDSMTMLISHEKIMSNHLSTIDLITEYEDEVKSTMFGINVSLSEELETHEDSEEEIDLKPLKERIKIARCKLYDLKRETIINDTELEKISEEIIDAEVETDVEEIQASETININDKLKFLSDKKILIIGKDVDYLSDLSENLDVQELSLFKGKPIDKSYDIVVKLTVGMKHSQGYDINSEVKKTGAKLITTSRRNKNLILDDIMSQM